MGLEQQLVISLHTFDHVEANHIHVVEAVCSGELDVQVPKGDPLPNDTLEVTQIFD